MQPPVSTAPPLRVLLLDDDTLMLAMLEDMLDELGNFEVVCASDAKRAVAVLSAAPPVLLVCDLSMPDMDGIEFMQAAASAGYRGAVILLSGMDLGVRKAAERLARAHGLNLIGAFAKPISLDQLAGALRQLDAPHGILHNPSTHSGK